MEFNTVKCSSLIAAFACAALLLSAPAARAGDSAASANQQAPASESGNPPAGDASSATAQPAKCKKAFVNPVTGLAYCIDPRGAPVDPPPASDFKPCKKRAHDQETGTTYEHYSGCW
jgi:hypothetical protein